MGKVAELNDLVRILFAEDSPEVRRRFHRALASELRQLVPLTSASIRSAIEFNEFASGYPDREKVACLIFSAIQGFVVSMRLFFDGLLVPSGNVQRQVLESIAMAVLCSKPNLGYLRRFDNDEYSSKNAIRDVKRSADNLSVKKSAIAEIDRMAKFYSLFSHPTKMTIALNSDFSQPSNLHFGGHFDKAKLPQYRREAASRIKLARILPPFVEGVRQNLSAT